MATRIQFRRDTAAGWTAANPILAQSEIGYELDTKKEKQGDGITAWNDLDYKTNGGAGLTPEQETIINNAATQDYVAQQIASNDKVIKKSFDFDAGDDTMNVFAEEDIIYTWPNPATPPAVTITGMTIGQLTPQGTYFSIVRTNPAPPALIQLIATIQ